MKRCKGFTLLEVTIAVAIFAISISIVYGLYASVVSVVQSVEERMQLNNQVHIAFARIKEDLNGLHRGESGYFTGSDSSDPGEEEPIIEFISRAHLSFSPDAVPVSLSVIRYYLEQDEEDTYYLLRSDTPVAIAENLEDVAEARRFRVCQGLQEVRLQYLDQEGDEQNEWDTRAGSDEEQQEDTRFPRLVAIELVFPAAASIRDEGTVYSTAVLLRPALIEFEEGIGG